MAQLTVTTDCENNSPFPYITVCAYSSLSHQINVTAVLFHTALCTQHVSLSYQVKFILAIMSHPVPVCKSSVPPNIHFTVWECPAFCPDPRGNGYDGAWSSPVLHTVTTVHCLSATVTTVHCSSVTTVQLSHCSLLICHRSLFICHCSLSICQCQQFRLLSATAITVHLSL